MAAPHPEALRHIELLTGSPDTVCHFRLIYDNKNASPGEKALHPAVNLEGSLTALWPEIAARQSQGYGVFVIVNEGGHSKREITRVRALFVDCDGKPQPEKWHIEPDFVVWRDETHWHAYWLSPYTLTSEFEVAQRRLQAYYGTDLVCDLPRIMRLAGTQHLKDPGHPRFVQIKEWVSGVWIRTPEELLGGLPEVKKRAATAHAAPEGVEMDLPVSTNYLAGALQADVRRNGRPEIGENSDRRTFEIIGMLWDGGPEAGMAISDGMMVDLLMEHWCPYFDREWVEEKVYREHPPYENERGCGPAGSDARKYQRDMIARWTVEHPPQEDEEEEVAEEPKSRFAPINLTLARKRPRPTYFDAHRLLPKIHNGAVELIYAHTSQLKTTWTAGYLLHLCHTKGLRVVYVVGEGQGTFANFTVEGAIQFWNAEHPDDPISDEEAEDRFKVVESMPQLLDPGDMAEFIEEMRKLDPAIIVFDTLGTALAGEKIFDPNVGTMLNQKSREVARALGILAIQMHHSNDKDEAYGNKYITAFGPDMTVRLEFDRGAEVLRTEIVKNRVGKIGKGPSFGVKQHFIKRDDGTVDPDPFYVTHELDSDDIRTTENAEEEAARLARSNAMKVYLHIVNHEDTLYTFQTRNQLAGDLGMPRADVDQGLSHALGLDWLEAKRNPTRYAQGPVFPPLEF